MKAIIVLAAVALAACNSVHSNNSANHANTATTPTPAPAQTTQASDNVKRVTTKELEAMLKDGTAIVVDVRNKAMYDAGHIRGAKLVPVTEIGNRAGELPKDKMIVTYCS